MKPLEMFNLHLQFLGACVTKIVIPWSPVLLTLLKCPSEGVCKVCQTEHHIWRFLLGLQGTVTTESTNVIANHLTTLYMQSSSLNTDLCLVSEL